MKSQEDSGRLLAMAERMAAIGYWRFDIAARKVVWSDEVFRIHGIPRTSVEPQYAQLLELYHPADREVLSGLVSRAMETGQGYDIEARVIRPDGVMRYVVAMAECQRSASGRIEAMFGVFQDVTDRSRAERFIRTLTANLPAMVSYWDRSLRCWYANAPYLDWFGRRPQQMIGMAMRELLGDALFAMNEPHVRRALAGFPQTFERTLTKPNGEVGHMFAQYIPDTDQHGEVSGFYNLVTDVTALTSARLRLEESNASLRAALARAQSRRS